MKRTFLLVAALGLLGLALSAMSPAAQTSAAVLGSNPSGEFALLLRLNGAPRYIGHTNAGADGGTVSRADAGAGNIVKTQCYSAACICPGTSCSCGNVLGSAGVATNGEYIAANGVHFMVLDPTGKMVTVARATGSLLLDAGTGAECDHWEL